MFADEISKNNKFESDNGERVTQSTKHPWQKRLYFILFMFMGYGANWVLPTALFQEIPYFELHQPEGLCIATYMNATTNCGLFMLILYNIIYENVTKIPYKYSVPILLLLSSGGCFFSAASYSITLNNTSVMLYITCAIGGTVGSLSSIIFNPYMTSFEIDLISAARSGGSAMILLSALIAISQGPGTTDRFSVSVFLTIFGVILILPIISYVIITKTGIGLKATDITKYESEFGATNPLTNDMNTNKDLLKYQDYNNSEATSSNNNNNNTIIDLVVENGTGGDDIIAFQLYKSNDPIDRIFDDLWSRFILDSWHERQPWLRRCMPYIMVVAWIEFNTWGLMSATMPFSMKYVSLTSDNGGVANLAIAYQLGAIALLLGDLSTIQFKIPLKIAIFGFTICCFTIYLAVLNLPGYHTSAAAPILIILFGFERFFEAHILTSCYRQIAGEFPVRYREDASRALGICDQLSTTLGAIVSTALVSSYANC